MITTPNKQSADKDSERKVRNAFNLSLLITVASALVVLGTFLMQLFSGEDYYVWLTAVGLIGGVIGMILARRGNALAACMSLVIALFTIAILYVILFDGVATMLIVVFITLSLGIVIQTVPPDKVTKSIIIVMVIGTCLVLLDQFWPVARNAPPAQTQIVITVAGASTILALVIFVVRQFPSFSLRGKLIGATLAVALIAVAVVALGVNIFTTRTITNQVGNNLNTLTQSQSVAIGEYLSRKINTLEALSANQILIQGAQEKNANYANSDDPPSKQIAIASGQWAGTTEKDEIVKAVLENDVAAELNRFKTLFPDNIELLVTDKYGGQLGATGRTRDYFKGDESWWQETYVSGFGSVYIGEPVYDSASRQYSITMAVPIYDKIDADSGEIVGIVQAIVSLDALSNILLNSRFGETGIVEIFLEGDRHLVVDDNGDISIKNSELDTESLAFVKLPDQPFIVTEFEDTSHFLSSVYINTLTNEPAIAQLRWIILATQHADEILASVSEQQRINTILGIIVIISAGVVAAYVGQRIAQPITNLTNIAEEVAAGNLDIQAPIETQDEIGVLAASFNGMTKQLRESIFTLEQRVSDRTQALTTSIEVGRQLSTILDENELVTAVVNQIRDAFNYYQAQIYLLDSKTNNLIMASGTGEAGQQMLASNHQLPIGTGLVGRAAETNQIILVSDVTQDKNWLANPLLPDTQSEAAVPITIGNQVMGVLDIQDDTIGGLRPEDSDLLQSVANQVAVALRNARLYTELQKRGQREATLLSINQKITSTTDMETAMKVAIRELGAALGTKQTTVRLGHHETAQNAARKTNGSDSSNESNTQVTGDERHE